MTQPTTTNDKTALVTGAARGIGLATTKSFLAAGWRVAMIDRDAPALAEAAGGLDPVHVELDGRFHLITPPQHLIRAHPNRSHPERLQ